VVKKPMSKFILRNVEADDLINQTKGLRAVKQRKRQEKHDLNMWNPRISQWLKNFRTIVETVKQGNKKRQKVSNQIQRGFDIVKEE
jgi:predicted patatin/cPLA2 family phospholipase